jgi:RNA polymerase primary sigma factor
MLQTSIARAIPGGRPARITQTGRKPDPRFLSPQRVQVLLEQVAAGGPGARQSLDLLCRNYQGKVRSLARQYLGRGLDRDDLVQEGNFGLISAIKNPEPESGRPFSIRACRKIRDAMFHAIIKKPATESARSVSLDAPVGKNGNRMPLIEMLSAGQPIFDESALTGTYLSLILAALEVKERNVLIAHIGLEMEHRQISEMLNLSAARSQKLNERSLKKARELLDIIQCVGRRNISSARRLKRLYALRRRVRLAIRRAEPKITGRPLEIQDIARAAGMDRVYLFYSRKIDPGLDKLIEQALSNSRREHVTRLFHHFLSAVREGGVRQPNTHEEVAYALGIGLKTLSRWRAKYEQELGPLLQELLKSAQKTQKGKGRNRAVIDHRKERYQKLVTAAREYQAAHPGERIPLNIMIKKTGIPERIMSKLITGNAGDLSAKGIVFRGTKPGQAEAQALARINELRQKILQGRAKVPKSKTALSAQLDISRTTLVNWQNDSDKVRQAVAALISGR